MSKTELVFYLLSKRGYIKKSPTFIGELYDVPIELARAALREARRMERDGVDIKGIYKKAVGDEPNVSMTRADNPKAKEISRMAKRSQRLQDVNRIERKLWRDRVRTENALYQLDKKLRKAIKKEGLEWKEHKHTEISEGDVLVVQLSDTHFNELVDLPDNQYDFIIAAKRLQKYAAEVKTMAQVRKARKIVVAMTGDLINSNRRLDEIVAQATNRAKACLLAAHLLGYFISDLSTVCPVDVAYVTGNESRVDPEWGFTDILASDNFDTIIFNILKMLFYSNTSIKFLEGNPTETVIEVQGVNILLLHGTTIKRDTQASLQQIVGKYAHKDILVKYVLFGHVHFANITDLYTRSGSLVGNNAYSDRGLNLGARASQVIHIISKDTSISNLRVDLQFTDGIDGYPIEDDIKVYDAKATGRLMAAEHEVVVIT